MAWKRLTGLGVVMGLGAFALHAQAADNTVIPPEVLELQEGTGGELESNGGPGIEQPDVTYIEKDDRHYLVSVYMSSEVEQGFWQCRCSSIELTETGPKVLANGVQLTSHTGGFRPCNHPRIANDGEHIVWTYGSDYQDPATTRLYAGVLDERCGHVITPRKVSDTDNADSGAPDIVGHKDGRFSAAYKYSGNGGETHVLGLLVSNDAETDELRLDRVYRRRAIDPADIGRPSIAAAGADHFFMCAAQGNQRPPEDGIRCAYVDAIEGQILEDQLILEAEPNDGIFYNSPVVQALEFGRFSVQVTESNGQGRKADERGATKTHLYIYEPSANAIVLKAQETDLGVDWPIHSAHCNGEYDQSGNLHMAVMGAPITGAGSPTMQMLSWSSETDFQMDTKDKWFVADQGDAGHLANLYGANPEKQGRDYLRCIGSVPNPGYDPDRSTGDTFMPDVKNFFVMPVVGKRPDEPKNSLSMSLVPGASAVVLEAPDRAPGSVDDETDVDGAGGGAVKDGDSEQVDGCSVSGPAGADDDAHAAWLALLGLGLIGVSRRRKFSIQSKFEKETVR